MLADKIGTRKAIAGCGTAGLLMAILPKIVSRWFAPHKRGVACKQMQQAE